MSTKPKPAGNDLAAFRRLYDKSTIVPNKIRDALAALAAIGEWEPEGIFMKRCGLSTTDFGRYRDQFTDFFIDVRPMGKSQTRVWAGTKKLADVLRGTLT